MRLFETRACEEGVINIISEEYLLRGYMLDHVFTFQSDAKAIPSIVPDYARTERNVFLRLLMLMSEEPVKESDIVAELRLSGIETEDVYHTMQELFHKHCSQEPLAPESNVQRGSVRGQAEDHKHEILRSWQQ